MMVEEISSWLKETHPNDGIKFLGYGSDSHAFRVGEYVYRFPHNDSVLHQYEIEMNLCNAIRKNISVQIPEISVHRDKFNYAKHKMIMGIRWHWHSLALNPIKQMHMADGIAQFFAELHGVPPKKIAAKSERVDYLSFDDIADKISPFLSKHQIRFFSRKYNSIVNKPVAASDMVICHMGVKGSNSVIDNRGNLIGVFDFGNAGKHERWRDLSVVHMGGNKCLYHRVLRKYAKLSGVKIDRKRINDLGAIEHFTHKRWFTDDGQPLNLSDKKIKKYLAKTLCHFYHLPQCFGRVLRIQMTLHKKLFA